MKTKQTSKIATALLSLATFTTFYVTTLSTSFAQGTAFTYQGRLNTNGAPYSGSAEFQFTLWDDASTGNAVATNNPSSVIATVDNGLFTVTLDFGISPFDGQPRFLQTDVRTAIGPFTTLTPRQPLTATPYALRALNLMTNGLPAGTYGNAVTFDNAGNSFAGTLTGTFVGASSGDGSGLTNVNASTLGGLNSSDFWNINGNAGANPTNGAFLGTTDNLPLELRVNNVRALRLEPTATVPNVIGGDSANRVQSGINSVTISGGTGNRVDPGTSFSQDGAVIGGGGDNLIGSSPGAGSVALGGFNVIAGGYFNNIRSGGDFDVISGGYANIIDTNSDYNVVAGGDQNQIGTNSGLCVIGGGTGNAIAANSRGATIPGGVNNTATNYAFAAGRRAKANHEGAFVWADSTDADFASTAANQFLIRASGGVGIGTTSPQASLHVNGSLVLQGLTTPSAAAATNLLNIGSGASADGFRNGISFFESGNGTALSLGYDGTGSSSFNALRIYHSTGKSLFTFQANGFMGVGTNTPQQALHVIGNILASGTITGSSDRNVKESFAPVNPRDVLEKVSSLPISEWSYKADSGVRHLGPMAQDFYSAFSVGMDDKHISMVDADGVALAAIQGLNQKVEQKETEITELKHRLEKLERLMNQQRIGGAQ